MATKDIDLGVFNLGNVRRLRATILKDGVAWTGITSVALIFEKPDRLTQFTVAMTNEMPDAGVWYYDTTTATWDVIGYWTLTVQVTAGSVVDKYPYDIGLRVGNEP